MLPFIICEFFLIYTKPKLIITPLYKNQYKKLVTIDNGTNYKKYRKNKCKLKNTSFKLKLFR